MKPLKWRLETFAYWTCLCPVPCRKHQKIGVCLRSLYGHLYPLGVDTNTKREALAAGRAFAKAHGLELEEEK